MLRALLLAGHHDARGKVRETHRRIGLVHVLAAGAARAEGVDLEVLGLDHDVADVVVEIGHHEHRRKRGLPARVGIEGTDADQAMHAVFGAQKAVGVGPRDREAHVLDARFVAGLVVDDLGLVAAASRTSAGTCASAFRPSPGRRCRLRPGEWTRWRRTCPRAPESMRMSSSLRTPSASAGSCPADLLQHALVVLTRPPSRAAR